MTIPVTTRSVKGSALSFAEMDDNFNDLGRNATKTVQGNVEIATQAETDALTSEVLAISPSTVQGPIDTTIATLSLTLTDLFTNASGETGTFAITNKSNFDIIEVEWKDGDEFGTMQIVEASIVVDRNYLTQSKNTSSGGSTFSHFEFDSDTSMTLTNSDAIDGITRVTGIKFN